MNARDDGPSFAEVDEILRIIDQFPAAEVRYERGDLKLHVRRAGAGLPAVPLAMPAATSGIPSAGGAPAALTAAPALPDGSEPASGPGVREGLVPVTSPLMGVYYAAPSPDAPPFVEPGRRVARGDDLCIIDVMKVMNLVKSDIAGTVEHIDAANAATVERGQALLWIRPEEVA